MIDTVLLVTLIVCLFVFLIYIFLKPGSFSKKKRFYIITLLVLGIVLLFSFTGFKKARADISRIIHNSRPKTPDEVYSILFKKPLYSCMTSINFKDQVIPKLDCCIWMEVKVCQAELTRIIALKKYRASVYLQSDSLNLLKSFSGRPVWWTPQVLGDTINKLTFQFNADNQQTLLFGKDSSHVYLCDQAL